MECKLFFPNLTFHQRQGTIINNKRHNTVCSRYIHNETICLLNGKVSLRRPELRTETELQAAVRGFASCFHLFSTQIQCSFHLFSTQQIILQLNAAPHHALFHSHYPCRLFTESFTQPSDFKSQRLKSPVFNAKADKWSSRSLQSSDSTHNFSRQAAFNAVVLTLWFTLQRSMFRQFSTQQPSSPRIIFGVQKLGFRELVALH